MGFFAGFPANPDHSMPTNKHPAIPNSVMRHDQDPVIPDNESNRNSWMYVVGGKQEKNCLPALSTMQSEITVAIYGCKSTIHVNKPEILHDSDLYVEAWLNILSATCQQEEVAKKNSNCYAE